MQFTGGLRIGNSLWRAGNYTWPFVLFTIEPDAVTLSKIIFIPETFRFDKAQITKLSEYRGLFWRGIRIEHSVEGCPPFIVFWTFDLPSVKAELVWNGYEFSGS